MEEKSFSDRNERDRNKNKTEEMHFNGIYCHNLFSYSVHHLVSLILSASAHSLLYFSVFIFLFLFFLLISFGPIDGKITTQIHAHQHKINGRDIGL